MKTVYFVGQQMGKWRPGKASFEVQGVFSSKKKAVGACRNRNYFVMPLQLNGCLPHEYTMIKECWYPKQ